MNCFITLDLRFGTKIKDTDRPVNDLDHAGAMIILKAIIKLPHCRVTDVVLVGLC
ncbi:hypothetical protein [uncultured Eudoraea sp.]|uniref:hypothetical protein n=1 Tax=uncultured Eudoraea sp. TaxID=1035614 RepID=UPI00261C71F0|nr:hypothetical protein [uncultured Eudoraea sp.]